MWWVVRFGTICTILKTWIACNFTKINTPPWVFFTFFKLYKWYQIAQRTTYFKSCWYSLHKKFVQTNKKIRSGNVISLFKIDNNVAIIDNAMQVDDTAMMLDPRMFFACFINVFRNFVQWDPFKYLHILIILNLRFSWLIFVGKCFGRVNFH